MSEAGFMDQIAGEQCPAEKPLKRRPVDGPS